MINNKAEEQLESLDDPDRAGDVKETPKIAGALRETGLVPIQLL